VCCARQCGHAALRIRDAVIRTQHTGAKSGGLCADAAAFEVDAARNVSRTLSALSVESRCESAAVGFGWWTSKFRTSAAIALACCNAAIAAFAFTIWSRSNRLLAPSEMPPPTTSNAIHANQSTLQGGTFIARQSTGARACKVRSNRLECPPGGRSTFDGRGGTNPATHH
jgi:hypothetical protein